MSRKKTTMSIKILILILPISILKLPHLMKQLSSDEQPSEHQHQFSDVPRELGNYHFTTKTVLLTDYGRR